MADETLPSLDEKREFYVYILYRPDGRPCYVGKGKGDRWRRHEWKSLIGKHPNPHLENIIRNAGGSLRRVKIANELVEAESFELERFLITEIRREINGGPLVNLTDGGEGPSGLKFSPEVIEKMSKSLLGKPAWNKGKKGCFSEETREKMRSAKIGKKQSPEVVAKRAALMTGRITSEQTKEKLSIARKGMKFSDEWRASLKKANRSSDPEVRAKISSSTRLSMANLPPEVRDKLRTRSLNLTSEQMKERRRIMSNENARKYRLRKKSDSKQMNLNL